MPFGWESKPGLMSSKLDNPGSRQHSGGGGNRTLVRESDLAHHYTLSFSLVFNSAVPEKQGQQSECASVSPFAHTQSEWPACIIGASRLPADRRTRRRAALVTPPLRSRCYRHLCLILPFFYVVQEEPRRATAYLVNPVETCRPHLSKNSYY